MIQIGKTQELTVAKTTGVGVYMGETADAPMGERILLPRKQVPEGAKEGSRLSVFVYRDSKDRLICTTAVPKVELHGLAVLQVVQIGKVGAFLDWGLEKDLFLPFREQTKQVNEGEEVLIALYVDKSGRLCATMNVYNYLSTQSPYQWDDRVTGRVYEISKNFGAFVAVDDKYSALIPKRDFHGEAAVGDIVEARVTNVHEDGKLDLSIRQKAWIQMDEDAKTVLAAIDSCDGVLPFTDKVSPEIIENELHMSKNAFKRAVGRLLKEGKIQITADSIIRN